MALNINRQFDEGAQLLQHFINLLVRGFLAKKVDQGFFNFYLYRLAESFGK
jgi:hypothetical protein